MTRRLYGFAKVRLLQEKWAAQIIEAALFSNQMVLADALSDSVRHDARAVNTAQSLKAYFDAHPEADVNLPYPRSDDATATESLVDLIEEQAYSWGDAGFDLGLAVGMLLNPAILGGRR